MSEKKPQRREKAVISAQGQIDNAPTRGGRASYLRLPEDMKFFVPKADHIYRLVFLPWKAGRMNNTGRPGEWVTNRFFAIHRNVGPSEASYLCLNMTFGKPCAGCEAYVRAKTLYGKDKIKFDTIVKPLQGKKREMFLVHDIDGDKNNLMIWEESVVLFGDFFRGAMGMRKRYANFADFDEGLLVCIKGKEKAIGTNSCTEFSTIQFESRTDDFPETDGAVPDWMYEAAQKLCPDDWLIEVPNSKLKTFYEPAQEEDEEKLDDPREDRGRGRRRRASTSGSFSQAPACRRR